MRRGAAGGGGLRFDIYPYGNVGGGGGTSNQAIIGYPHCYLGGAIPSRQQRHTKHSGGIRWPSLPSPGESKSLADTNLTS